VSCSKWNDDNGARRFTRLHTVGWQASSDDEFNHGEGEDDYVD